MVSEIKKPIQCLLLSESLIDLAMNGEKRITIKEGHRDFRPGKVILACPDVNWCKEMQIFGVRHTTLNEVTAKEYTEDGFISRTDMFEGIKAFYPDLDLTSPVTVILLKESWEE